MILPLVPALILVGIIADNIELITDTLRICNIRVVLPVTWHDDLSNLLNFEWAPQVSHLWDHLNSRLQLYYLQTHTTTRECQKAERPLTSHPFQITKPQTYYQDVAQGDFVKNQMSSVFRNQNNEHSLSTTRKLVENCWKQLSKCLC